MYRDFLAMEHYRLHVMEQWPDSPVKRAALAAVRATLASLAGLAEFECDLCHRGAVIQFPSHKYETPERKAA